MYYDKMNEENKKSYKNMLKIVGSLSRLFSDSENPFLYYRAHENIFSKYFNINNNARSDDSADAYDIQLKVGIGLKTWVGRDTQKVAEFGRLRPEYEHLRGIDLVRKISEYRNKRIKTTMNAHGLNSMVYHIVKRENHSMMIYEHSFDFINIDNITIDPKRGNKNSTYFSDGNHTYNFSLSKNTLYMIFDDMELLDEFNVKIEDDPYELLSNLFSGKEGNFGSLIGEEFDKKEQLCLRLYSTKKDGSKFIPEKSGLNQWNGFRNSYKNDKDTGKRILYKSTPRNRNEVYIPYPKEDRVRGDFFPQRDTPFSLMLPDGSWISAKVCQSDGKAIMSNPNEELGKWLLRDVFELDENTVLTYKMLKEFGVDSVMFTKLDELKYSVDFCTLGTYESFYDINDSDSNSDNM